LQRLALGDAPVIYGDGKQTRDFVYVEDVVQAIFSALQSEDSDGEKINVGSGRAVTINEVVGELLKATGKHVDPVCENMPEGEILHSVANIEKAERLLDYHPRKQFEEGLREAAETFLQSVKRLCRCALKP
jgi:UDP-glucose 4-epimerase